MMGADLARARAGKRTQTGMSEQQLMEYASTPRKGLPAKKMPPKGHMPASHKHMSPKEHTKVMKEWNKKRK